MKPLVFYVSSVEQVEAHIRSVRHDGLAPTVAIVFSSVVHNLKEVGAAFAKFNIEVFGASTSGEILNDEVHEGSIVAMLLDISPEAFRLNIFDGEGKTSYQVGQSAAEWAKTVYDNPALMVVTAGLFTNGDQIVNGITDTMDRQVPLFGGRSGDDLRRQETFVFSASKTISNGVVALIFDQSTIDLQGIAVSGWKGIGTPKTITKAEGNIVYEIDNEPVLDMYNKYLNIGDDIGLALEYPLLLLRDDGTFVMRVSATLNEDKSMVYGGTMPEGSKVRFSMPPGLEVIDHAIEQVSAFHQQIPKSDAIVLFSCKARHMALGPMVEDEISAVHKLWEVPMVGFFTYGEIGPVPQGRCDFHNHTLVPVLIKEK
ncbi:MAG: FIST N-terminal domain-containing protein [Desulfobacterales bacterium]|jgi:hypothetical protein